MAEGRTGGLIDTTARSSSNDKERNSLGFCDSGSSSAQDAALPLPGASPAGTIDVRLAAKAFKGAKRQDVEQVLETLVAFGEARALGNGRFTT